jgi:hypothetical protein
VDPRELASEVGDRRRDTRPDVQRLALHAIERELDRSRDVFGEHEVAGLAPVLVDQRTLAREQARREDRHHPRVGVRQ